MPIQVTCPGCHARFQVSDKFAGQTGPCPKCKHQIRIPEKNEEVVIHAPENYGPKNAQGRATLKPLSRTDARLSVTTLAGVIAGVLVVLVAAVTVRLVVDGPAPWPVLALGAVVLAPPLVLAGYFFLHDDELEPHRGASLGIRVAVCSVVYAALWLVLWYVKGSLVGSGQSLELFHLAFVLPALIGLGAFTAFASLDLDFGNAALHYAFYLLVTSLLRMTVGLPFL